MSAVWMLLATAPSPTPSPTQGPSELQVTPGLAGFVATFAVALACVLLFLSLTRHLRRARHNAEEQGIPVEEPKHVGIRRAEEPAAGASGGAGDVPGDARPGARPEDETDGQAGR
ncbi:MULTISPECIES: hypothetical protein [unclassified Isoptericola]|uniref:hypothetical protein n=1 Tax=Isoptericola sp. NPDC057191 TaxID=3346041 RepID=UPI003644E4F3